MTVYTEAKLPLAILSKIANQIGLRVIFGNGNVNQVKVQPALCQLEIDGKIVHQHTLIVAENLSTDGAEKALLRQDMLDKFTEKQADNHLETVHLFSADLTNPESYRSIKLEIERLEKLYGLKGNRIYYLGLPCSLFETVISFLGENSFLSDRSNKILIEKPFGKDKKSAKKLNQILARYCDESQIFRIDHYLLKETIQNLMFFRFANSILEPIWSNKYIESITILALESVKVQNRIYDGAFADMISNHLLEVLATTISEIPISLDADDIRSEKVKILRCTKADSTTLVVGKHEGYEGDKETLAGVTFYVNHPRWAGVAMKMLTAKAVDRKLTQVVIKFNNQSLLLFPNNNRLIFRLQPNEGIIWECAVKSLGENSIVTKPLQWLYNNGENGFNTRIPDAYETLFLHAVESNTSLFVRNDEVEALWEASDPAIKVLENYHQNGNGNSPIIRYPIGLNPRALLEFVGLNWEV